MPLEHGNRLANRVATMNAAQLQELVATGRCDDGSRQERRDDGEDDNRLTHIFTPRRWGNYGIARAKGGRIELQPDMSLIGVEGDRNAVVINASNLPAGSFPADAGPNAAVRMGLGHNTLEWLTVRDAGNAQANIDSGLQPLDSGTAYIWIAHVASTGSTRGLNILNFGPQASGQTIEADIIDCYFFDNDFNLSEGVRIGNFQGARGSTVNVRMSGNLSWGQKTGRLIVNNRAIESTSECLFFRQPVSRQRRGDDHRRRIKFQQHAGRRQHH